MRNPFVLGAGRRDRRERRGLRERDLAALRSSSSARNATACSTRESPPTSASKSNTPPSAQHRAEALEELRDGREAQRHVRERHLRRLHRQPSQRRRERARILRREPALGRGASGAGPRRKKRSRSAASRRASQPAASFIAPVLREPPRELLGGLLGLELGELGVLIGEESRALISSSAATRTRNSPHASRSSSSRAARRSTNATTIAAMSTSAGLQLLLEDERQQQVERAFERIEIQLELAHRDATRESSGAVGRGPCGTAIAGRFGRRPRAAPARRAASARNCTRGRTTSTPTTMPISDTQALSRSPAMWCAGSTRRSSSKKRPTRVQRDVEREQPGRPEAEAAPTRSDEHAASEVPDQLVEERRMEGGASRGTRAAG